MVSGSPSVQIVDSTTAEPPHEDDGLIEFVEALQQVDITSSLAKLNATSIADNNGGRIEL